MEDEEFDLCNKKCKSFLDKNRYGKLYFKEIRQVLEAVFRQGYELGKKVAKKN